MSAPRPGIARDEEETRAAVRALAGRLAGGELIALEGDLGAGKTVFVRGLAAGLGHDPGNVVSPSFVLAVEHPGGRVPLLHVDLYRLPPGSGIDDLGIEEALAAGWVVAVEWGEKLPGFLRTVAWRVLLGTPPGEPGARTITILPPATPAGSSAPPG